MATVTIPGEAKITSDGIKKHFKSTEPLDAVIELIWNGFDARADNVEVSIQTSELGAPVDLSVKDDGLGIDFGDTDRNFGRFNDSEKKDDIDQHGSHGRGRLAFHKLAQEARWFTKRPNGEATISVDSSTIQNFKTDILEPETCHGRLSSPTGTLVVLNKLFANLPDRAETQRLLSEEFGCFLTLNAGKRLAFDGESVGVPSHELYEEDLDIGDAHFQIKVFRWNNRPSSEKSYIYLLDSSGRTIWRDLSTLNNKPNFFTSIYVKSAWADDATSKPGLFAEGADKRGSDEWRALEKHLTLITKQIYNDFLRQFVDVEIAKYEEEGTFPSYQGLSTDDAAWRLDNVKSLVRTIFTADPSFLTSMKKKPRKVLVGLMDRLSISNENESLFEVLDSVLELDKNSVELLASQLRRTTLENIVSTIELLQRRQIAVRELRELMNEHYDKVLETPDLQKIIENNTWLFGPQYEILGAEEATFTKIARDLRDSVKEIGKIEQPDLEGGATIEGASRQPDLFLARKFRSFDSFGSTFYRCVIVEIKRPSIALNIKHLRQLDDYAAILKRHPEFTSGLLQFELILVGRKISDSDIEIASRLKQQLSRGEMGLVTDDVGMKRYVMNWYTLLDGYELTNSAFLEKLKLKRDELSVKSSGDLVSSLQSLATPISLHHARSHFDEIASSN